MGPYQDVEKLSIEFMARTIKEKIAAGQLYGKAVDMSNVDALIVAAYYVGQTEERQAKEIRYVKVS